jgi:AbrB family looped-hinge helix DNA binding protein
MSYKVGIKGQIVIEKHIRERLGVQPGWQALQTLVDDHIEIYFVPPEHNRSLAGSLAKHIKGTLPTNEAFRKAKASAWAKNSKDQESHS